MADIDQQLERDQSIDHADVAIRTADGHLRPLRQIEADVIRFAVVRYGGNMVEVARRLGISRSTLYRKLEWLGIGTSNT